MNQEIVKGGHSTRFALGVITTLFFAWGFITVLNDVLIPHLKGVFSLTLFQATLIQFAFFGAYFIGALVYFLVSLTWGDPIARIGYKNGVVAGLVVAALGCILFVPAATVLSYPLFLGALFVLGLGLTLLQIAANPYVALLGKPETASARLNLAQGFNSLGTTISPIIGGYLIFTVFHAGDGSADSVKMPYVMLAAAFAALAGIMLLIKLPKVTDESEDISVGEGHSALRHSNLVWGIGAIFCYVGAEVAIGSLLINFAILPEILGGTEASASKFLALYWGGAMTGRFVGAIGMSDLKNQATKIAAMIAVALGLYTMITLVAGLSFANTAPFLVFVALNIAVSLMVRGNPSRTLAAFAGIASALIVAATFSTGNLAFWFLVAIGLFNSIMWSNIFTLAIAGLGKATSQGSSLLVMAILGGALVPPLQGLIADEVGLHSSFLVLLIFYGYIIFFGLKGYEPKLRGAE